MTKRELLALTQTAFPRVYLNLGGHPHVGRVMRIDDNSQSLEVQVRFKSGDLDRVYRNRQSCEVCEPGEWFGPRWELVA